MNFLDDNVFKKILYTFLGILIVGGIILVSIYIWYGNNMGETSDEYSMETKEVTDEEERLDLKEASSTSDKNIESANTSTNNIVNLSINTTNKEKNTNTNTEKIDNNVKNDKNTVAKNEKNDVKEEKKELKFQAPVDGEIIKDFANETLIYSKTLDEWTTHLGIDIKGDKTTIVKSAEAGTVESIKNDPRYGLTVTIAHSDGFKTVYSNLLTTEFVKEGDTVEKGDTIATIGETASFEILDESHLHFEMYKNEVAVNPTMYLK